MATGAGCCEVKWGDGPPPPPPPPPPVLLIGDVGIMPPGLVGTGGRRLGLGSPPLAGPAEKGETNDVCWGEGCPPGTGIWSGES